MEQLISSSEIQEYFMGVEYPRKKRELIEIAEEQMAPESLIDILNKLPNKEYKSSAHITKEVTKLKKTKSTYP